MKLHDFKQDPCTDRDAPDVTGDVMERLGFERNSRAHVVRERITRGTFRAGGFLVLLVVVILGTSWDHAMQESVAPMVVKRADAGEGASRAQALSGLLAPFERLEQAIESAAGLRDTGTPEDDRETVQPVQDLPVPVPFRHEDASAPFPWS